MILGTVVAALYDLTFDLQGYVAIMLSNLFTSLNGVVMKKTIQVPPQRLLLILLTQGRGRGRETDWREALACACLP